MSQTVLYLLYSFHLLFLEHFCICISIRIHVQ